MRNSGHRLRAAITGLCSIWLLVFFSGASFSQAADAQRAQRIRNQFSAPQPGPATREDLESVRNDVKNAIDALVARIEALEKDMVDAKARILVLESRKAAAGNNNNPRRSAITPSKPKSAPAKMQVSMCASGCDASKFEAAAGLVLEGGTLTIQPGVYFDCILIRKSMKLVGTIGPDGSRAHLKKIACGGKGAIVINAPEVTIQGVKISDISVRDKNGACIRVAKSAKALLIRDIICLDSENGLLGGASDEDGVITIEDSTFQGQGKDEKAHGIYFNGGANAILRNVKILASHNGHLLKTGARNLLVENSVIAALEGASGTAINAYGGGKLTIRNSVLQLGPNTENHNFLSYADSPGRIVPGGVHEIVIENNWFIYDDAKRCCRWLFNSRSSILDKMTVRDNKFVGGIEPVISAVNMSLNKEYADRKAAGLPTYDGTLASMPKTGS